MENLAAASRLLHDSLDDLSANLFISLLCSHLFIEDERNCELEEGGVRTFLVSSSERVGDSPVVPQGRMPEVLMSSIDQLRSRFVM
eukprot:1664585-Rhodomonas_salina.3